MKTKKFAAVGLSLTLALGLAACTPEGPTLPPTPTQTSAPEVFVDPETQLIEVFGTPPLDTRGVEATEAQKTAFSEDVANQPDISTRVLTEGLNDSFIWNLAYIGATAPADIITPEVREADLTGFSQTPQLLDGLDGSEFAAWVAEESGIPEDSIYFHVPMHLAQLGVKHFGG